MKCFSPRAGGELHRDVLGWPRPLLPYPPLPPRSPARGGCQSQHHTDRRVLTEGSPGAQLLSQRLRQLLRLLPDRPERYLSAVSSVQLSAWMHFFGEKKSFKWIVYASLVQPADICGALVWKTGNLIRHLQHLGGI